MVTLHAPQWNHGVNRPVMPVHKLQAKKNTTTCAAGDVISVFISKYSDGRFAIMDSNMSYETLHYEVHTEESLHESFDEIG